MLTAETNKQLIRETEENDYEKVKELVMGNEYLALLWGAEYRTEERLEQLIKDIYMRPGSYCVIDKQNGNFCGSISYMIDDNEGELSVRMMEEMDVKEIMNLFAELLGKNSKERHKNFTIQYTFE